MRKIATDCLAWLSLHAPWLWLAKLALQIQVKTGLTYSNMKGES